MGIMDMFRNITAPAAAAPPAATGTPGAGQPGNIPATQSVTAVAGTGTVPVGSGDPPVGTVENKSPMDEYKDLWKTTPTPGTSGAPKPLFDLDPVKLLEAAKTIDYSKSVTPEQLAAISKGGEEGTQAFLAAMQNVAATTMMHSAATTGAMVEQAVKKTRADLIKEIPGLVRGQNLRESAAEENPGFNHPAVQPIVTAMQSQFQVKHPNATTAELREMTNNYLNALSGIISPPKADTGKGGKATGDSYDWSSFLPDNN